MLRALLPLFFLILAPSSLLAQKVELLLSWNLKPYWQFVEGFRETGLFEAEVVVLKEVSGGGGFRAGEIVVAVGHRALSYVQKHPPRFFLASLVLHPSLVGEPAPSGGVFLLLPPEQILPSLREALSPFLGRGTISLAIPYSTTYGRRFVSEAQKLAPLFGFRVLPVPLREGLAPLEEALSRAQVLYLLPDPFWESEELIAQVLEKALRKGCLAVGFNRFFLEKGAFLAFLIDYRLAGELTAHLLKECLTSRDCSWRPAPFRLKLNKHLKNFYFLPSKGAPKGPKFSEPVRKKDGDPE